MSEKAFEFPFINFAAAAQRSDMRYCELLKLVAAHKVQAEHENGTHLIETKDQYLGRVNTKIQILKDLMDNAIDAGDIIFAKRTATTEMKNIQENLCELGVDPDDFFIENYQIRANLDINLRSFTLWATEKRILLPAFFYTIYQIEPPKALVHAKVKSSTDTENTKVRETLLKMVIAMAINAYKYNPNDAKSAVVPEIVKDIESCGLSLSENTVRKYLKEAVNNVLEGKKDSKFNQ